MRSWITIWVRNFANFEYALNTLDEKILADYDRKAI